MDDVIFEVKIEMLLQLAISIGREFHTLGPLRMWPQFRHHGRMSSYTRHIRVNCKVNV